MTEQLLGVDEIRWPFDEPAPARHAVEDAVSPPSMLTGARADLVTWWRWRYSTLEAELARLEDLLIRAVTEAQAYREVAQASLTTLHDLTDTTHRQRQTIVACATSAGTSRSRQ